MKKIIGIIMGSDSDLPVMKGACEMLNTFGIGYEVAIVSAHRTPERMYEYARSARENGFKVIIAGAGGAAHLPGMVASLTSLPVIGVPVKTKAIEGLDSLLSIVQMPPGIPVATVAVNGSMNAGILAASILGTHDEKIYKKVEEYKKSLEKTVLAKSKKLETESYQKYIDEYLKNS